MVVTVEQKTEEFRNAAQKLGPGFLNGTFAATNDEAAAEAWIDGLTQQALNGDENAAKILAGRAAVAVRAREEQQKKEKDSRALRDYLQQQRTAQTLRDMEDNYNRMCDLRDRIQLHLDEINAKIAENKKVIDEIIDRHKNAAEALRDFEKNGIFERDPDGTLKNKAAQELLDAYIKRTGQKPESDGAIHAAIMLQIQIEQQQREALEAQQQQLGGERTQTKDDLETVTEEIKAIEEIRTSGVTDEEKARRYEEAMRGFDREKLSTIYKHYSNDRPIQDIAESVKSEKEAQSNGINEKSDLSDINALLKANETESTAAAKIQTPSI